MGEQCVLVLWMWRCGEDLACGRAAGVGCTVLYGKREGKEGAEVLIHVLEYGMRADLRKWVEADPSAWPDAAFLLNVGSTSLCHQPQAQQQQLQQQQYGRLQGAHRLRQGGRARSGVQGDAVAAGRPSLGPCPAPVLSLVKEWSKHRWVACSPCVFVRGKRGLRCGLRVDCFAGELTALLEP